MRDDKVSVGLTAPFDDVVGDYLAGRGAGEVGTVPDKPEVVPQAMAWHL